MANRLVPPFNRRGDFLGIERIYRLRRTVTTGPFYWSRKGFGLPRPPHRSRRAELPHRALTSSDGDRGSAVRDRGGKTGGGIFLQLRPFFWLLQQRLRYQRREVSVWKLCSVRLFPGTSWLPAVAFGFRFQYGSLNQSTPRWWNRVMNTATFSCFAFLAPAPTQGTRHGSSSGSGTCFAGSDSSWRRHFPPPSPRVPPVMAALRSTAFPLPRPSPPSRCRLSPRCDLGPFQRAADFNFPPVSCGIFQSPSIIKMSRRATLRLPAALGHITVPDFQG
jgi:hypothetical protein